MAMQIFRLDWLKMDWLTALTSERYFIPEARVFDYKVGIIYNASEPNAATLAK
jgi:hypothetical protein